MLRAEGPGLYMMVSVIARAAVRPSTSSLDNFIVLPTAGADPDRRTESRIQLIPIVLCRVIKVLDVLIAAVHVWSKCELPMIIHTMLESIRSSDQSQSLVLIRRNEPGTPARPQRASLATNTRTALLQAIVST